MIDYIATALVRTVSEGPLLFGGVFVLAVALLLDNQTIARCGNELHRLTR